MEDENCSVSSYVSSEEDESEIFHDIKEISSEIVDDLAFVAQIVDLTKNSYYTLTTAGQAEDLQTIPTNVFPVANEESLGNDNDDDEDAFESEPEEVLGGEVEEEEAIPAGPLRTAHEIIDTPTHEKIHVEIPTYENIVHIGEIVSQISTEQTVVIKSIQTTTPLDEGSLLCFENREPFGIVNEIFGPLNQPFYVVKGISSSLLCREALGPVNNPTTEEGEVDVAITLAPGTKIYSPIGMSSYVTPLSLSAVIKNSGRPTDASNLYDEEPGDNEMPEFSDDEKEQEWKRLQRVKKESKNGSGTNEKKKRQRDHSHRTKLPSSSRADIPTMQQYHVPPQPSPVPAYPFYAQPSPVNQAQHPQYHYYYSYPMQPPSNPQSFSQQGYPLMYYPYPPQIPHPAGSTGTPSPPQSLPSPWTGRLTFVSLTNPSIGYPQPAPPPFPPPGR